MTADERSHEPQHLSEQLIGMLRAGDIEGAVSLYEDDAVFADLSGAVRGLEAIRRAHEEFVESGLRISLDRSVVIETDDLALVHWAWTVTRTDGSDFDGVSAEVLRRQPDGRWKFVLDNSDGTAIVDAWREA